MHRGVTLSEPQIGGLNTLTVKDLMALTPEAKVALLHTLPDSQRWTIVRAMTDEERAAMLVVMTAAGQVGCGHIAVLGLPFGHVKGGPPL